MNQSNNQNNQTNAPAFSSGNNPFAQAGSNIFDSMKKTSSNPNDNTNNMPAPSMDANGMPSSASNMPQQPQGQQGQQNQNQQQPQQFNINTGDTPSTNQQNQQQGGGSPLDKFNQKTDNSNNGTITNPPQQQQQQQAPEQKPFNIFDANLKGWTEHTSKIDLVAGIKSEDVQAALAGDANKFMEILQSVTRSGMSNIGDMSMRAAGVGVKSHMDTFSATVPDMISNHQFKNMFEGDAVMNHDSARPMVAAMTTQLRQQHPDATPAQIQAQVQEYFSTFTTSLTEQNKPQNQQENTEVSTSGLADFFNP